MDDSPKNNTDVRDGHHIYEMSVGEVMNVDTHEGDVTNLIETRAMNSVHKITTLRERQTPRVKKSNTTGRNVLYPLKQ